MKILFVSDSLAIQTGLNYVTTSIMLQIKKLIKDAEIGYANILGPNIEFLSSELHGMEFCKVFEKFKIYNCQIKDPNTYKNFDDAVESFKPDVVFTVSDPWNLENVAFSKFRDSYKWLCYVPIEVPVYPEYVLFPSNFNTSLRKSIKNIMENADMLIPVTPMGKGALERLNLTSEDYIYHGTDTSAIFSGKYKKSEIFTSIVNEDNFIFMTMGENSERKRIDKVIESFALFIKNIENPDRYKLYLHTNLNKVEGPDLVNQLLEYKLERYILAPSCFAENKILRKEDLFKRYAVSDCYVSLPAGEGFGYGLCESMLQGIPCIYTNYGGPTTYLDETCGIPIPYSATYLAKNANIKWVIADVEKAAEAMTKIAVMPKEDRLKMGRAGQNRALKLFDWNIIGRKFSDKVLELQEKEKKGYNFSFLIEKHI